MLKVLIHSLPLAVGLNFSPVPLIVMIMILMTPKAKVNSYAYLFGWFIGIFLTGIMVVVIPEIKETGGSISFVSAVTRIVLGVLCFVFVLFEWVNRNNPDSFLSVSRLFKKLDKLNIWKSVLLGLFFTTVAFKNLILSVDNALHVKSQLNSTSEIVRVLLVFAILSGLCLFCLAITYSLLNNKIDKTLHKLKNWLTKNNRLIVVTILCLVGVSLIYEGVVDIKLMLLF